MSTLHVLGFAAILIVPWFASDIARQIARLFHRARSALVSLARALRVRGRRAGAGFPRSAPLSSAEWIALGMTRGNTKWK